MSTRQRYVLGIAAIVVIGVLVAVARDRTSEPPTAMPASPPQSKDTSCHNPFRHGEAERIDPKESIDLAITDDEWPELTGLLEEFARTHDWSFRDSSVVIPGEVTNINVSVCADNSLQILVLDNHWKTTHAHDHPGKFTPIFLYGHVPADQWQPVVRDLVGDLEGKWPGKVRFVDAGGNIRHDRPSYLSEARD